MVFAGPPLGYRVLRQVFPFWRLRAYSCRSSGNLAPLEGSAESERWLPEVFSYPAFDRENAMNFLCGDSSCVSAAGAAVLPTSVRAQAYPSRPVKMIIGQAAGSATDTVGRLVANFLSERLGQQFIVETRPGAAGNIATEAVTRVPPDGYTMLVVNSQNTINTALYEKLNFDFVPDIAPIGRMERVPLVMVVNPSVPANTLPEFIAYAKANPGKVNIALAGIGGPQHIAAELFKFMAGVDITHVPYRGTTPAVTDLIGGQVQVMFDVTPTALPQIKAGKLRPLGVTTTERLPSLPDVPTVDDFLKATRCPRGSASACRRARRPRSSRRSTSRSTRWWWTRPSSSD